jgi:DNA-binding Xre family transcriptional regulator
MQISEERRTAGIFLLSDIAKKEVGFVTNDYDVVRELLKIQSKEVSLNNWLEELFSTGQPWDIKMVKLKTLDSICDQYKCLPVIIEYSRASRSMIFASIRYIPPESVKTLSQMLLLFGVLHREPLVTVQWSKLNSVVAKFLMKVMETGKLDLCWLGYNRDEPEQLIWRETRPPYAV